MHTHVIVPCWSIITLVACVFIVVIIAEILAVHRIYRAAGAMEDLFEVRRKR